MKCEKEMMRLYAVTDRTWCHDQTLLQQVQCALKGGVTCVQLREKHLDDEEFLKEAIAMKQLCEQYHVPFIINDNVDIAIKCHADGVHVGQNDMDVKEVRSLVGDKMMIGVSTQTLDQALKAQRDGADYLGVGSMFVTTTKLDALSVSFETLKDICESVDIPVVAIGGINKDNILQLSGSHVDGVALVSAIFGAHDIQKECQILRQLSEEMVKV